MKETLKEANYKYITRLGVGEHIILNCSTGDYDVFIANKNHASWGIKWKNTHLEFVRTLNYANNECDDLIFRTAINRK
jgi:hypothetical protein